MMMMEMMVLLMMMMVMMVLLMMIMKMIMGMMLMMKMKMTILNQEFSVRLRLLYSGFGFRSGFIALPFVLLSFTTLCLDYHDDTDDDDADDDNDEDIDDDKDYKIRFIQRPSLRPS